MDYEKLGVKIGIEIHQELRTRKLFCDCSTDMNEKGRTFEIKRKLRPVAGETGEVDRAAQYEFLRDRSFTYHGYDGEACLVDTDSEPPHPVNPDALRTALGFAKLTKLNVPEYVCVMRKTVTDGSAVSGFQRTILMGTESKHSILETSKGIVKINQLNLEEDACKIENRDGDNVTYSLSRLGIPLLEIGTDPSVKDPEHAKEVSQLLGNLLRSFDTVKRGLGTIRQDVNISIREGARIEVKGWQDLRTMPKLVENEISRQVVLVEIKKELHKRGLKKFDKKAEDLTKIFSGSTNKIISSVVKDHGVVIGLLLPKFAGLLKKQVCEGKTFGRELSEYAKAYGTKGMIHTDEDLQKYGLEKEFEKTRKILKAGRDDLIIVIAENKSIAKKAIDSVYDRACYCLKGVPEETRIPNHATATSSYARPLPGAHRMYPETDVPNIAVTMLDSIELPEPLTDKIKRISKELNIQDYLVKSLIREGMDIEAYSKKFMNIKPQLIAEVLIENPKELKKRFNLSLDLSAAEEILEKLNSGEIGKSAILDIMQELAKSGKVDYSKYRAMDTGSLENEVRAIIDKNKGVPVNGMIGIVMGKLRGKAEGRVIVEIVKKYCK